MTLNGKEITWLELVAGIGFVGFLLIVLVGIYQNKWRESQAGLADQNSVSAEVEKPLDIGTSTLRQKEIDPCAGLEVPGKYVPRVYNPGGKNLTMVLHFKGRVSQGHRNCIGDAVGVESTWVPAMTHYQIVITRAELYSWEDIKQGIERVLRPDTVFMNIDQDGGQPAQTDKANKEK